MVWALVKVQYDLSFGKSSVLFLLKNKILCSLLIWVIPHKGAFIKLGGGGVKPNAYVFWHGGGGCWWKDYWLGWHGEGFFKVLICFDLKARYALHFQTKCL